MSRGEVWSPLWGDFKGQFFGESAGISYLAEKYVGMRRLMRLLLTVLTVLVVTVVPNPATSFPGQDNLEVSIEFSNTTPRAGESVDVVVVVRDPDPFTYTHYIEVKFGNGGLARDYYLFLLCGEVLSATAIVDGSYVENRFTFPYTYRRPGTYTIEATVRTHQNVCVASLEPEQEGKSTRSITVL